MSDDKRGKFLQQLRIEKNLTQKELSEMLHYSDNAISSWEKGKTLPNNPETLVKLSEFYDVSIEELLYGERKNTKNSKEISNNMENIYRKNYRKFKKVLNLFIILLLVIVVISLMSIYFIFIKGKILSYTIQGVSEHFLVDKSSILFTDKIDILNFNKIIPKNGEEIDNIKLYYIDEFGEKLVFNGPNDTYYIEEVQGYNEYNLDNLRFNDVFIDVKYNNNLVETISLNLSKRFINDDIFSSYSDSISETKSTTNESIDYKFIDFLAKEGFIDKGDEYEKNDNNIRIIYNPEMNDIYLYNQAKNIHEMIELDLDEDYMIYELLDEKNDKIDSELYSLKDNSYKNTKIKFIDDNIEYLLYLKSNI